MTTDVGWCEVERPEDAVGVVRLQGEHDLTSANDLSERLEELAAEERDVILDLSETSFLDSSILHTIYRHSERQRERGGRLVLQLATEPLILRVLEVSGLLEELPCAGTRDEAIRLTRANPS